MYSLDPFRAASSGGGDTPPPNEPDDDAGRFEVLLSRVPIGILVYDSAGKVLQCNPAALNLLGLTRADLVGSSHFERVADVVREDGVHLPTECGPVRRAIAERQAIGAVIVGVRRAESGARVWLEVQTIPRLTRVGDVKEVICLLRDVTEIRAHQAIERRLAEAERDLILRGPLGLAFPGASEATTRLRGEIQEAARTLDELPVLVVGEPGTGKTLVARTLHAISARRSGPFEVVNCAGISASLFESEVFGHEKGAFTGATTERAGHFELAHRGTLFLDEVGDLPLDQQAKLLVALQERRVRRLGGKVDIAVDIAVVAATNHDLPRMVADSRFRADLYDRLNGSMIRVPTLRDRAADMELMATAMLRSAASRARRPVPQIDPEVLAAFRRFGWPGNVRQLDFVIRRMMARATVSRLTTLLLPEEITTPLSQAADNGRPDIRHPERIEEALSLEDGNVRRTAKRLGVSRARLYRLMKKLGIRPPR